MVVVIIMDQDPSVLVFIRRKAVDSSRRRVGGGD
jgi:hypothetical protein